MMACVQPKPTVDIAAAMQPVCDRNKQMLVSSAEPPKLAIFDGAVPPLAVHLQLTDGQLFLDGETMTMDGLTSRMKEKAQVARELAQRSPDADIATSEFILQLPKTASGSTLMDLLNASVNSGFDVVHFVGWSGKTFPAVVYADPAFASQVHQTKDAGAKHAQRERLRVTDGVMEACPPLVKAMEENKFAGGSDEERCQRVISVLESSLGQCPDADAAKIVTLFQLGGPTPGYVMTSRTVHLKPDAPVFEVSGLETWEQIVPRLLDAGPDLRFALLD